MNHQFHEKEITRQGQQHIQISQMFILNCTLKIDGHIHQKSHVFYHHLFDLT
jgi:hypothetical protein